MYRVLWSISRISCVNIIEIQYDRIQADLNLNETILHLAVEVSSKEHGEALIKVLKQKGYEITME